MAPYSDTQACIPKHPRKAPLPALIRRYFIRDGMKQASLWLVAGGAGWCVADDNLWQCGFLHPSV